MSGLGARMVPFAGYDMPVQYPTGIIAEHNWTRSSAGLFDVSHMGQCFIEGPDTARLRRRRWNGWCQPTCWGLRRGSSAIRSCSPRTAARSTI